MTTTLPATRLEIPESEYNLTGLKTLQGRETRAVEAKLRRGKTVIAHVHNDGNGGMTFVNFVNRNESDAFTQWVDSWTARISFDFSDESWAYGVDTAVDAMVEEIILAKALKAKAKTKLIFLEEGESPLTEYHTLNRLTFDNPRLSEYLAKYAPTAVAYWNNEGWVPVAK